MRPYFYALPLALLLPACTTTPLCGGSARCASTDFTITETSDATDSASSTDAPTGTTAGTETGKPTTPITDSDTDATSTTDEPSTTTTTTGDTTTDTDATGTTGEPSPVGKPATHGEACAPDDGPAVEFKIDLAERKCDSDWPEDVPFLRIVLFEGVDLATGEHPLTGGWGFAWYDDGNGVPLTGDVGTVVITEVTADGVRGTYDVTLSDDTQLTGAFDSLYCPVDVLCG